MVKVSVLIPAYNQAELLKRCLNSFKNQSNKDFEIIVVDDGSKDNTLAVLKEFKSKKIKYFSQENRGPSAARNLAYSKSKGRYIAYIDADQEVPSNFIEEILKALDHVDAIYIPERSASENFWTKCIEMERIILYEHTKRGVPRIYKRELINKIGFFDERLKFGEDWELFQRAKRARARFGQLPLFLIHHEVESPMHTIKKYFKYGIKARKLVRKKEDAISFYAAANQRVMKNLIKYFFKDPFLVIGSLVYRCIKTLSALIGYLYSFL